MAVTGDSSLFCHFRFRVPKILSSSWMTIKWLAVDAAEVQLPVGMRYRVGIFDGAAGTVSHCPAWVKNQQVAELYGTWILIRRAARARLSQCAMFHDSMQAIWNTINLRSRAGLWRQNRILRAVAYQLRRLGMVVHVVYVPTDIQLADPISRAQIHHLGGLESAVRIAKVHWSIMISELHHLECKGISYVLE